MTYVSRLAIVSISVLVVSALPASTPAHALSCLVGVPFVGVTAGVRVSRDDPGAVWDTVSTGTTTVTLVVPTGGLIRMSVWTENCTPVCFGTTGCSVTYTGTLSIRVGAEYEHEDVGVYTLSAVPVVAPPALSPGSCNVVNTGGVCANVETGSVVQRASVQGPWTSTGGSNRVVGAIDSYRFPLPTGGLVTLPCVVITVNSVGNSGCGVAGGTYVSRIATLVDQTVTHPSVGLSPALPLASVGVCTALVTFTVSGFGVEEVPAYSLC